MQGSDQCDTLKALSRVLLLCVANTQHPTTSIDFCPFHRKKITIEAILPLLAIEVTATLVSLPVEGTVNQLCTQRLLRSIEIKGLLEVSQVNLRRPAIICAALPCLTGIVRKESSD